MLTSPDPRMATVRMVGIRWVSTTCRSPAHWPPDRCAPATLKYRRLTAPRPFIRACSASAVSTASLEAPYGLVGLAGADSLIGTDSGSPEVAAHEPGAGGNRVGVAGRQVVEHRDLMPRGQQLRGDDASDVTGTAGHEQPHSSFLATARALAPGARRD